MQNQLVVALPGLAASSWLPDRTYVSSVERGERNITLLNIPTLATVLDMDAGTLLAGFQRCPQSPTVPGYAFTDTQTEVGWRTSATIPIVSRFDSRFRGKTWSQRGPRYRRRLV